MFFIWHIFVNGVVASMLRLKGIEILLIILGGVLIDIDHLGYMFFGRKLRSVESMVKFHRKNFASMTPHLYVFHFLEVIMVLLMVSYFINWYLFLIFVGFWLHWVTDVLKYLWIYGSFRPWSKYFLLAYYLVSYKN